MQRERKEAPRQVGSARRVYYLLTIHCILHPQFHNKFPVVTGPSAYDFPDQRELTASPQQELLDSMCEMYFVLKEEDYWVGMWLKRAQYSETATALAYQQQGLFEQAQTTFGAGKKHGILFPCSFIHCFFSRKSFPMAMIIPFPA